MARLELVVDVLTRGADELSGLGDRMGRLGRNLTLGVTTPLIAAGGAAVALAADAERSQARLSSVFGTMEADAWTTVDALNAQAEAIQSATTFDDEAVADAQAVMLTFGEVTGEAFDDSIEAAADLAAFWETDMQDSAQTLGKALQDPIDGMSRLGRQGIIFSDEQKELVESLVESGDVAAAQGVILDEVGRQVGDVAEDLAATTGGQMQQAMSQLANAGEAIGVFLLPVLATLAGWLTSAAQWFQDLDPGVQGFIVGLAAIAAAVGPVLLVGSKLIGAFQGIIQVFNLLKLALLTNPFTALAAAVVAIAALIVLNWDQIVAFLQGVWDTISDGFTAVGKWIQSVWKTITGVFSDAVDAIAEVGAVLWEPIAEGLDAAIGAVKGIWNAFARWWNSIEIGVPAVDVPFLGRVGGFAIGLPDLPMLAEGGIVTAPTLALIGEAGPEAVIPLDKMGSSVVIEVNVLGDLRAEDPEEVAGAIGRVLWSQGITDTMLAGAD